jgi:hypothetical protein
MTDKAAPRLRICRAWLDDGILIPGRATPKKFCAFRAAKARHLDAVQFPATVKILLQKSD